MPDRDVYTFNGLGQVVQDASVDGGSTVSITTTVYNGDRTTVIPPQGGVVKSTVTDPLGRTSEIDEYTAAPALVTPSDTFTGIWYVTGGTSTATAYGYDGHGNQSAITAGGQTWTSTFNLLGQVTSKQDPDAGATSGMTYDGDGNLLQATNADGATVSYTYDGLSRKTAEYAAATGSQSPADETASWVYDNSNNAVSGMTYAVGQLTTQTSYSGGAAYTTQQSGFNVWGESLGETVTIPSTSQDAGLSGSYTFSHTYTTDSQGLPRNDSYPAAGGLPAETVGHTYLSTPLNLAKGLGGSIDAYAQNTDYDAYGDVVDEQIGIPTTKLADIVSVYDPHTLKLEQQTVTRTVAPTTVDQESYTYDLAGNPTSQTSVRLGSSSQAETQCYRYDGLDQLTAAWTATDACAATPSSSSDSTVGDGLGSASEYWTTWSYGVLGNMTSQDQHSVTGGTDTTTTDTYGGASGGPDALTGAAASGGSTSNSTFGYDAAGNMTSRDTPADGSQSLTWTADGKLASVTGPGGATSYVYDADGNLLLQEDPGSSTLYLPGEQLTAVTANGTTTVTGARIIPLPSGGDVVRTGATTSYSFEIPDQQGTNDLSLDNTAQVPAWRQFTPYGAARGAAVTWVDNRGFLDKPADAVTGLTYVGARAYDPGTGQFLSPDPVLNPADPQDLNPYDYAEDNPVTSSDPTGLCGMDVCGPGIHDCGPNGCGTGIGINSSTGTVTETPDHHESCTLDCNTDPTSGQLNYMKDLGYKGSKFATVSEIVRWLQNNIPVNLRDEGWDFFCMGLAAESQSNCGGDPFTGNPDIYWRPSTRETLLGIGAPILAACALATEGACLGSIPALSGAGIAADAGTSGSEIPTGSTAAGDAGAAGDASPWGGKAIVNSDGRVTSVNLRTEGDIGPGSTSAGPEGSDLLEGEPSTVAGVIAENQGDLSDAFTTYAGSAHYDTGGYVPAASDHLSGAMMTAAMVAAAVIEKFMGRL